MKIEYDELAEQVRNSTDPVDAFLASWDANEILLDCMSLKDNQRTLLKSSILDLLELQKASLWQEKSDAERTVHNPDGDFRYNLLDDFSNKRIIRGQEIIDWITDNQVEDVSIITTDDGLYFSLTDIHDSDHYVEFRLNRATRRPRYEAYEMHMEKD